MFQENCLACDIITGKKKAPGGIIYENEYWMVDHSVPALIPGFLIIKPKRHCEQIAQLSEKEMASFGPIVHRTCQALSQVVNPEKVYVASFGEYVKHVHFFVIPRTSDMPANGSDIMKAMWVEKRWVASEEQAAQITQKVREAYIRLFENN